MIREQGSLLRLALAGEFIRNHVVGACLAGEHAGKDVHMNEVRTMPKVMLRKLETGAMTLYVPKKDLEERVVSIEFDTTEKWGGIIELADGTRYKLDIMESAPKFPITLQATRA